jgi:uncharacterized protein YrrD
MLKNIAEIYGHRLAASDGDIGHVKDFYFDDKTWVVRYLIADTGSWLAGRQVLLSPHALGRFDEDAEVMQVNLTKKQIEHSPSIETHKPVSRQYEVEYYNYYGWPAYWNGGAMWGLGGYPVMLPPSRDEMQAKLHHHREDKHLQSTLAIKGFAIEAVDGAVGHVTGLMIDDQSWAVVELVIKTGLWFFQKEILLSSEKVERISYEDSAIYVKATKADLQHTAEYDVVDTSTD